MRMGKTIALITSAVTAVSALAIIYEYNRYANGKINFTVNNKEPKCENISDIKEYVEQETKIYMDGIDITDCIIVEAQTQSLNNISFLDYIRLENNNIDIDTIIKEIDIDKIRHILTEYNNNQEASIDAKIVDNGEIYEVQPEKIGGKVSIDKIIKDIQSKDKEVTDIKLSEYINQPKITSEDLQDTVDNANKYITWKVEYNSGQEFTGNIKYVSIDGDEVVLDTSIVKDIVRELETVYDTAGKGFEFTTNAGDTITVYGGTYGDIMSSADEREYLLSIFENAQTETNRQPIMKQEKPKELGNTYLEISIQEQHLWHYEDGELVSETDVVTGDANKKRDTPTGVYFISERINGKYLTGATYRTWVNKWMRLTNSGVGLHDAGWRGSFGGNIYKGNGSHGCINLPKAYAYDLYNKVYTGVPVIIY